MGRPPRCGAESGIHHVMNRGVDHGAIFFDDVDRLEFGRLMDEVHELYGVTFLAYCLMTNHFHLLVSDPHGRLSEAMHHLTGVYARRTNARIGRDGPLFKGRYLAIPVEDDAYLLWVCRYIHLNPLDIVEDPRSYRWSSLRTYFGLRPAPRFLDVGPVMAALGGDVRDLVALTEGDGAVDGLAPDGAKALRSLLSCAVAVVDLQGDGQPARPGTDRALAVLLARRTTDVALAEDLFALLALPSAQARRSAASRAERRLLADESLARMLAFAETALASSERVVRCLVPNDTRAAV